MPTYQYRCTQCGQDLEAVQKFSDPALTECPNCHGQLRKVFNAVGVVFKGSGFYRTDNRDAGKSKSAGGSTAPASSGGSSTSAGSSATSAPSTGSSSPSSTSSSSSTPAAG